MAIDATAFRSARLKVRRANRHIEKLDDQLRAYSEGGAYGIDVHSNADYSDTVVIFHPTKPVPDGLPLIIGDAVHNLRTALDHFSAAAYRDQGRPAAYFPFRKNAQEFVTDKAALDTIEAALPGARRVFFDDIQPYENGKLGIYAINQLDRIDKHNELILVTHASFVNAIKLTVSTGLELTIRDCWLNPHGPLTLYHGPGKAIVECDFEATLEVRLGKALPLGDKAVLPALIQLSEGTAKALDLLEALVT